MEAVSLSPAEIELIKKMGLDKVVNKILNPPKPKTPPPVVIKMEDFSGTVTTTCLCCGVKTVKYVDYVKRKDCEGYAIKTVQQPSHEVKRSHVVDTISCELCKDDQLFRHNKEDLIEMIIRLRKHLRKGEK